METDEVEKQGANCEIQVLSETRGMLVNLKYPEALSKLSVSIQTYVLS